MLNPELPAPRSGNKRRNLRKCVYFRTLLRARGWQEPFVQTLAKWRFEHHEGKMLAQDSEDSEWCSFVQVANNFLKIKFKKSKKGSNLNY